MEFNPNNKVVKLCLQGMSMEDNNQPEEASKLFLQASYEATNDFERFLAAYYVARHQKNVADKLKWLGTALRSASEINDDAVKSAFPSLYESIAKCYEELHDFDNAKKNYELADSFRDRSSDKGPFYHGTKADLQVGDLLTAGYNSNYKPEIVMNHIYFTALINGAGLAAALAKGDGPDRIYIVEPTGSFENDPNVTDKKFPGNPTRSYRSQEPLKIVGEITDWVRLTPEERQQWQQKIANLKGEIIN
ncbi:MAG: NAD(+)--rifampin ADP-ribosyltransferase [Pseudosphingobacterium sp.]|jgi:rifampin ADP-ribosylating transferase|uniref:NAD(+)--rifampin ADP-ribosyltransferase n=1 Tax=Olivibacter sp. 47 TaxID=3056486 RepID=UPI001031FF02|nr:MULTISPECIES: NAD(+)--rifampin ADP-ribosyltransferase [Olivibacter]MCL4640862.1 NAD(+)--rifampin ADP-ribosyltransferase [Olivibacter sp. UJ_SKK_5.1]MDM8172862.1 NAD(+)--rifampin ADP-ribosyltransferase [Olivibacter sp. 47]MDX3915670.1 NAD(+)--rifampin ADP-ribosyltransferase [Pseudosphingobacterium sp.]QEL02730.1 NAD(+)--rifampin ADP-ribosyltransferase [Olivibacter sp. LS-1]